MKYTIATGSTPYALELAVKYQIERGFIPQGGVSYSEVLSIFIQAMIKVDKE